MVKTEGRKDMRVRAEIFTFLIFLFFIFTVYEFQCKKFALCFLLVAKSIQLFLEFAYMFLHGVLQLQFFFLDVLFLYALVIIAKLFLHVLLQFFFQLLMFQEKFFECHVLFN